MLEAANPFVRPVSDSEAALLLSSFGISNVAGRLSFGLISDRFNGSLLFGRVPITALLINNLCLLSAGSATILIPFCTCYWALLLDCIFFGFTICECVTHCSHCC